MNADGLRAPAPATFLADLVTPVPLDRVNDAFAALSGSYTLDGKEIVKLALRGGPTYVKLGQLIASTRGLAPEWLADSFAGCRDAVPPAPSR